ncbi:MAG: type II secretion system GspH family protein [Gammaproteobacteria bacterium]|nr:type II secretion system GspH family protein [Gammaproteobacteria bacterium]
MNRIVHQAGFSLIEMAIVMVIIGLLLGGLLTPLSTQREIANIKSTQELLDETLLALMGYAYSNNGQLPCPDIDNDGLEDGAINCTRREGDVPWSTLGTTGGDSFGGNLLGYRLDATLTNHSPISCTPTSATMSICTESTCAVDTPLTSAAALVLWSHGKNGLGAGNAQGNTNLAPTSADELANIHTNNDALAANDIFVKRIRTDSSSGAGEFDDMIEYRTDVLLCAKMVEAGIITP